VSQLTLYAGSARCAECHPRQAIQRGSRHAATLSRFDPQRHAPWFRRGGAILDPLEGVEYRTRVVGGRCVLQAAGAADTVSVMPDYAFGSGGVSTTYVSRSNGVSTELRLSHYNVHDEWQFTPGQRVGRRATSPVGAVMDKSSERACFSCHSTALLEVNGSLDPEHSILGIECEACHGPGAAHIEAVMRRDRDLRMPALSSARQRVSLELCGSCHRSPGSVDLSKPGMAAQLPRLQAVALSFSECFKKGGVACMTCHNPHENAGATGRPDYNRKCLSCHAPGAPSRTPCKTQPAGDCVSCHMPKQDIEMPGEVRFRNHWIKVWQ